MTRKAFNPDDWKPKQAPSEQKRWTGDDNLADDIERMTEAIESRRVDITGDYRQWLEIGFALKEALGEAGRDYFHRISRFYPGYSEVEADKQYDKCMRAKGSGIQPRTLFYFAKQCGIPISYRQKEEQPVQSPGRGVEGFEGLRGWLPDILEEVAENANSEEDAGLLILGAIVTLSACLPHLSGVYGDRPVFPNLFLFVTAPASAGKGRLTLCRRLAMPIQQQMNSLFAAEAKEYRRKKAEYEYRKKRDPTALPPEVPKRRTLIIPANASATMVYQILSENEGRGLMFETEGDTLAIVFDSDYGDYSDGFRKAFHHEPISYTRRKDREFVELLQPKLSAVLSGTPRQIATLIRDTENGLFSRFIFYYLDVSTEWINVFQHDDGDSLDATFDRIGEQVLILYQNLSVSNDIQFCFTSSQKRKFNSFFSDAQKEYLEQYGKDIIASVRRLGLITYRIAMIISILRMANAKSFPPLLFCQDVDFDNALAIAGLLLQHTARVYQELSRKELYRPVTERPDRKTQLLDSLPSEFSTGDAIETAQRLGISLKSVERYLKEWRDSGLTEHVAHGKHKKINPLTDII